MSTRGREDEELRLALWKKAVAGGFSLLALCVLLVVKPSRPKADDSLTESLTPDTEVYHAVKVDRAAVSVWSERPPDAGLLRKGPDTVYSELQSAPHEEEKHTSFFSFNLNDDFINDLCTSTLESCPRASEPGSRTPLSRSRGEVTSSVFPDENKEALGLRLPSLSSNQIAAEAEGSVEYAELSREQAEVNHHPLEVNHHRPEVNHHPLEVNHHRPEVNHHRPEVNHHPLEVNHHRPEVNHHPLEVNHHRPEVNHHPLEVNHHPLEVNHHRPEVNHHPLEVNHHRLEVNHHQDLPVPGSPVPAASEEHLRTDMSPEDATPPDRSLGHHDQILKRSSHNSTRTAFGLINAHAHYGRTPTAHAHYV
ncbi:hypothetical protein EYF80_049543 [Liparis tanakae]|uniref:Uncharacterized protein n=1 Tax=Liparis tanakae TaxID=230148 RepID=A0A4Z2FGF4_9TELE|nr:hypothetical protein EYF80_049543 [Liparis tanakae]